MWQVVDTRHPRADTLAIAQAVRALLYGVKALDDDWFVCKAMLAR